MDTKRLLLLCIVLLVAVIVALVAAWIQQAAGVDLPAILGCAGGGFTATTIVGFAALAFLDGRPQPPPTRPPRWWSRLLGNPPGDT